MQLDSHANPVPANGDVGQANANGWQTPLIFGLGALLALQLLIALVMGLGGNDLSPAESRGPLLAFETDQVTRLRIASGDRELILEKTEGGWQIPALGGFPVTEIKIADLLEKLAGIQKRIPLATSESAVARFKVASDDFERRLTLEGAAGPLGTLYLGDSPGFRRLFVRTDGEQAVYEAELALFDASDKADDWTKKTVLHLEQDEIQGLALGNMTLTRGEIEAWSLSDLAEDETLDQNAAMDLIRQVANLDFRGVLGTESKAEYGQDTPALTLKVTLGDETLDYALSKRTDSEEHVLKVSNRPHYFSLSQYSVEDLLEVTRDKLVEAGEESAVETAKPTTSTAESKGNPDDQAAALPEVATDGGPAEASPEMRR